MSQPNRQRERFEKARAALREGQAAEGQPPREHPDAGPRLTDVGNAERFVTYFGRYWRYCPAIGWLAYTGARWERDQLGQVMEAAKRTVRLMYEEAAAAEDETRRKDISKHARGSEAEHRLRAMVTLARSERGIPVRPEDLDADPMVLNCRNGVIDLRTGERASHRPEALLTKLAGVPYDPRAECPRWQRFLREIFEDDGELIAYVQRVLGYALTGAVQEHVFLILYGSGANGKSTLIETIHTVMGDYATHTRSETFLQKKHNPIPLDVAALRGSRFVFANEGNQGRRLDEGLIKSITGGDTITARFLHQNYFSFMPTFKLFLVTNHLPTITGTDEGIWRRVHPIRFNVTFATEDQDHTLPDQLRAEGQGILVWLVQGCLAWQREGLGDPLRVRTARQDYRACEDQIGSFLDEQTVIGLDEAVTAKDLYTSYGEWAKASGETKEKVLSKRALGLALKERGFTGYRTYAGRGWLGLRLRGPDEGCAETREPQEAGALAD